MSDKHVKGVVPQAAPEVRQAPSRRATPQPIPSEEAFEWALDEQDYFDDGPREASMVPVAAMSLASSDATSHLAWVAQRARTWADRGDMNSAAASAIADLKKNPDTQALASSRLLTALQRAEDADHVEDILLSLSAEASV